VENGRRVDDILSQLRTEWVHAAFLALQYGVLGLATLLYRSYRRTRHRVEKYETENAIKAEARNDDRDDAIRRYGLEISDIKQRVCVLAAQIQHDIPEVDIPEWPNR